MRRAPIVAAAVLLAAGCGDASGTDEPAAAPSSDESLAELFPTVMSIEEACDAFTSGEVTDDSDPLGSADRADEIAESLRDPVASSFADLAAATRDIEDDRGGPQSFLGASEDRRNAAAAIDEVC